MTQKQVVDALASELPSARTTQGEERCQWPLTPRSKHNINPNHQHNNTNSTVNHQKCLADNRQETNSSSINTTSTHKLKAAPDPGTSNHNTGNGAPEAILTATSQETRQTGHDRKQPLEADPDPDPLLSET